MQKEVSLIRSNNNFISKLKSFFARFIKNNKEDNFVEKTQSDLAEQLSDIEAFEYLKGIIDGKINIKDLDKDLEKRLIDICNNRMKEIDREIEKKEYQIEKAKELLENLNNM